MSFSVVIPVYNSAEILPHLIKELERALPSLTEKFEVILVNDGSQDQSWRIISELCQEKSWVKGIQLIRNYGQHNALLCGIRQAKYDITITMDDDLQHPPAEIPKLIEKLEEGYDVVYGPPEKERHGVARNLASIMTKWALKKSMGVDSARNVSAFRVFHTKLRSAFSDYKTPLISIDVLLTWGGSRFGFVNVKHNPRFSGQSNYTFKKLVNHAFNMITGFTIRPLQLANFIGFLFVLFGIIIFIYVTSIYFLKGGKVPGFPFLASIIAIFSGVQLFVLGIIGEYLARIHLRTMESPQYIVDQTFGDSRKS